MYRLHPSTRLVEAFSRKPYQGVDPLQATFLFVGLDANYAPDIEGSAAFQDILDYHEDGVAFWQRTGVHHPFLLPRYRGDGKRYHQRFAQIGFTPAQANQVSFVELLHLPTVGRSDLNAADLDIDHLRWIDQAATRGSARHTFVSAGVLRLMQATGRFPWVTARARSGEPLKTIHSEGSRTIHLHLHFSNFGKFEQQLVAEGQAIAALMRKEA